MRAMAYLLELPASVGTPTAAAPPLAGAGAAHAPVGWSVEGVRRLLRHGSTCFPEYSALIALHWEHTKPSLLQQVRLTPVVLTTVLVVLRVARKLSIMFLSHCAHSLACASCPEACPWQTCHFA